MVVDPEQYSCVGLDINANHLRAVKDGRVIGTARPIHLGATTQVWSIEIKDEKGRMVCISRLTMAVLQRKGRSLTISLRNRRGLIFDFDFRLENPHS